MQFYSKYLINITKFLSFNTELAAKAVITKVTIKKVSFYKVSKSKNIVI